MNTYNNKITRHSFIQLFFINLTLGFASTGYGLVPKDKKVETYRKGPVRGNVKSKDGTQISFLRSGTGPALILVHGTSTDVTRWIPVLPLLENKFTLYAIDRRGRGESGDAKDFAFEREVEDVIAVINLIKEPVNLLGHSYGAICCLEAMLLTDNVRKLIIYEPPLNSALTMNPETERIDARIEALIENGDREAALLAFMTEIAKTPPNDISKLQASPAWPGRVANAHTIPRERRAVKNYKFLHERFQNVKTPTLLLLGGDSSQDAIKSTEMVKSALLNSRIAIMPGQKHNAMITGPEIFKTEVVNFLSE